MRKRFDFKEYSVILTDSTISYERKVDGKTETCSIATHFEITINEIDERIVINWVDRWSSSMQFSHIAPSSLKGMFDFIARGYNISLATQPTTPQNE